MSSNQFPAESTSSESAINPQVISGPIPVKSMRGKYDGRVKANKLKAKTQQKRKPFHNKHVSRNYAAKLFERVSIVEECEHLLRSDDLRLRFEVIRYLWDRLEGKPFVATNPDEKPAKKLEDNRLQVAIQQLIVAPQEKRKSRAIQSDQDSLEQPSQLTYVPSMTTPSVS